MKRSIDTCSCRRRARALQQCRRRSQKEHPEDASLSGSLRFFEYLKNRRPDLLMDFRASGDKWKAVRSWLRAARKVKD
jgi:hypothetical protein